MEYKTSLQDDTYLIKVLICKEGVTIEIREPKLGKILRWSNLTPKSLFEVQTLNSILNDLPFKLATAIKLNQLEKPEEYGFHCLISITSTIQGLNVTQQINFEEDSISIQQLSADFDEICQLLKNRLIRSAVLSSKDLLNRLQPAKIACHLFLHFAYGELFNIQSFEDKVASTVNREMWIHCFEYISCPNLLKLFQLTLDSSPIKL
jgi:hypothetical protein